MLALANRSRLISNIARKGFGRPAMQFPKELAPWGVFVVAIWHSRQGILWRAEDANDRRQA